MPPPIGMPGVPGVPGAPGAPPAPPAAVSGVPAPAVTLSERGATWPVPMPSTEAPGMPPPDAPAVTWPPLSPSSESGTSRLVVPPPPPPPPPPRSPSPPSSSKMPELLVGMDELRSFRSTVSVLPWASVTVATPVSGLMTCLLPSGKVVVSWPSSRKVVEPSGLFTLAPWVRSVSTVAPSGPVLVSIPLSGSKRAEPPSANIVAKSPSTSPVCPPVGVSRPSRFPRPPRSPRPPFPLFRLPRLPRFSVVTVPSGAVETACPVAGSTTCSVPSGNVVVSLPSSPSEVTDPSGLVTCPRSPRSCVVTLPSGCVVVSTPLSGSNFELLPSGKSVVSPLSPS